MIEVQYAVHFTGTQTLWNPKTKTNDVIDTNAYYALKQPTYEWCFTEDLNEANLWKTEKGARKVIKHGINHNTSLNGDFKLVKVKLETVKTLL